MGLIRVRFTVRWIMAAVAVSALASLAAANVCREIPGIEQRLTVLVASVIAAAYGLGSMRRPFVFLAPLPLVWVAMQMVDHPGFSVFKMSLESCFLGWIIGAPVGFGSRWFLGAGNTLPVGSEPARLE